jgi:hypothetical protein
MSFVHLVSGIPEQTVSEIALGEYPQSGLPTP